MKIIANLLLSLMVTITASSCSDFLTYSPSDSVDDASAIKTVNDVTNALNGVYYTLGTSQFYGRNVVALGDIAADNMYMVGTTGHFGEIYKYTVNDNTYDLLDTWSYGYKVIDRATRLIVAAPAVMENTKGEADKERIKAAVAQCYGIRALSHFALTNIFGLPYGGANNSTPAIILVKEKPIVPFEKVSRSTVEEAYQHVLADIQKAKENIDKAEPTAFFLNPAGLEALEARVKLYMKDYAGAITAATAAITHRKGSLVMDTVAYVAMWGDVAQTSEDIFTVGKLSNDNLSANSLNTLYGSYNGRATSGLLKLYGPRDMRRHLFTGMNGETQQALKYKGLPASAATSNIPLFRLPEMYLILAEALAQQGKTDEAIDQLWNVAQRNPDLKKEQIPTAKEQLLTFISVERRRELFQEGHRWFDLRRTGEIMTRVGGNYPINAWDASKFVYPIPSEEVNASGIGQNVGWDKNLPK